MMDRLTEKLKISLREPMLCRRFKRCSVPVKVFCTICLCRYDTAGLWQLFYQCN